MTRFRFSETSRQVIAGSMVVHAQLLALRGEDWSVVGVFSLAQEEWETLVALCNQQGIEVTHDAERSTVSS